LESFSLEKLEKWLDDEKKILETETVLLKDKISSEPVSVLSLYEKCFSSKNFPKLSETEAQPEAENKAEITSFQESQRLPSVLTIQEVLILLRPKWQKGYTEDFDKLVMKTKGCSLEEAEALRERWIEDGSLAYDAEGLLCWVR